MPGATDREQRSTPDLAKLYWPPEVQGQTDSTLHSLIFFALEEIRKFILSYFGLFWALEIRRGRWWALQKAAQDGWGVVA